MYNNLLSVISFVCICRAGLCADECQPGVLAKRNTVYVPEGGILALSCVVQHCGHNWTGTWMWGNLTSGGRNTVNESLRHHLTSKAISASQTKLELNIQSLTQSDEGFYGCMFFWNTNGNENGHLTYVNITAAVPSQRNLVHRVLICASAAVCLPIILGLACCVRSRAKRQLLHRPQVIYEVAYASQPSDSPPRLPPRRSLHKAPPKVPKKTDVVYTTISQNALQQQRTVRKPDQSATIYSLLAFDECTVEMD